MTAQDSAIYFADEVSRLRVLTAAESDMLIKLVEKQRMWRSWTARDDRELKRLSRLLPAHVVAEQVGRTPWAVRNRIRRLKQKEVGRGSAD